MEEEKPAGAKAARTVRAPLIITVAAVVFAGAAYYAFYRSQVIYYTGRNLRLISTLTDQIRGRAGMYSNFFRDGVALPEAKILAHNKVDEVLTGIEETPRGWRFRLQDKNDPKTGGNLPLDLLLKPIFARRVSSAFDMVLLADTNGQILFSLRTPPPPSSLLGNEDGFDDGDDDLDVRAAAFVRNQLRAKKERESGAALSIAKLDALYEKKGWREYAPLKPASLLVSTRQTRVLLGDDEYLLFTQPYTLAYGDASIVGKTKQLIVCGLVAAPRFRYSVTAVSVSIVFIAVGIALLVLCCWPFLRIALIHPSEELTLTDVALLAVCTVVGACVLTLGVLDIFAYHTLARQTDEQLEQFSQRIVTDFSLNVKRAIGVLAGADQIVAAPPADTEKMSRPLPAVLTAPSVVSDYPYVDALLWMDRNGKQLVRFTSGTQTPAPLTDSSYRQYFRDALKGRTWTVGDKAYVLEWVRSRATGEVRAVLAQQTTRGAAAVVALSTDLIDLTYPVRPPGVQFAIIEENGEVVYHSDTERIGYENFFAETDRNRDLRSAVLARHATTVEASYWGEDQSMFVRPLDGSPWTLVTFRAKRLARVLNVEVALLTLVLLLLAATPYIVLYIVTLIAVPRYRAPSIWPDEPRRLDYLRLCIIYLALLLLFGLTTYVLKPWSAFYAVLLIPAIATLGTYLVLHRSTNRRRFNFAAAMWVIANAFLFVVLLRYDVAQGRFFSSYPRTAHTVLVVVAVMIAALTAVLMSTSRGKRRMTEFLLRVPLRYTHLYRACGVLLLLLCTTLPVAAFFKISREVQTDLLVKYGQLRAAADLEQRIAQLERLSVQSAGIPVTSADITPTDMREKMFGSTWALSLGKSAPCKPKPTKTIARMLPAMYEDSTAIRPLFAQGSADCLWRWHSSNEEMKLIRKVRFEPNVSSKLWPNFFTEDQTIEITTPRAPMFTSHDIDLPPAILCSLGILAVFWYATSFIAKRVLLIDVSEPDWMARLPLSPTLGDHIFLVRRDRDAKSITGNDPMPFADVSFEEIAQTGAWNAALAKLDSSGPGKNIRILDFEHGVHDENVSAEKLRWLERLMSLPDRTVVIVSAYTPAFLFTIAPADTLERWHKLLDRFVIVTAEELELRHQEWQRRKDYRTRSRLAPSEPKNWLQKETAYNPFLRRLRDELEPEADRAHLLDEIGERAETYYSGLWSTCRSDEKLMLYQLANNGLANGRNRRALRRLIGRGLVRRGPNIELFSETFRLYVLAAAQRENLVKLARAEYGNSTWDLLRIPFFVVIISFLILLFATQKDLLTTTTALATAMTTGLPVIMKLIGVFAERRGGTTTT
jgi:hypothetical protein